MLKLYRIYSLLIISFYTTQAHSAHFIATQECALYSDINSKQNLDSLHTMVGKEYAIFPSHKGEVSEYFNVEASNQYPESRWVSKDCGNIKFIPFFTEHTTSSEQVKTEPTITKFDQQALDKCGQWGHQVSKQDLEDLLSGAALQHLYKLLDQSVITTNADLNTFKEELVRIWFQNHAFEHVICGQPSNSKDSRLGGLHYVGRYLEGQKKQWIGLNNDCKKAEIAPPIYSLGVDFITLDGKIATKCPAGYTYNLHVFELISEGTKAFKQALEQFNNKQVACTYRLPSSDSNFTFVTKRGAITTFYPHISPKNPSCSIHHNK